MSTSKSISIAILLIAALFTQAADAGSSRHASGRVSRVDGTDIELQLANEAAAVGDVYELRHHHRFRAPKAAFSTRRIHVAEVRVAELLGDGRVRAIVVKGSPRRGDRVYAMTGGDAKPSH